MIRWFHFFVDMKAEREIIQTKSIPDIQTYCAENGLHFQLIDMPWTELPDFQTIAPHKTISEGVYNTLVSTGKENDVPNIEKLQEWYDIDAQSEQLRYVLKVKILDVVFNHRVNEKERAWYDVSNWSPQPSNGIVYLFQR